MDGGNVGRMLYRALLIAARALDVELSRCESLRPRELSNLRSTVVNSLPKEIRPLVPEVTDNSRIPANLPTSSTDVSDRSVLSYVRRAAREIVRGSFLLRDGNPTEFVGRNLGSVAVIVNSGTSDGPDDDAGHPEALDDSIRSAGFLTLRHMNSRLSALEPIVYTTTSDATKHGIRITAMSHYEGSERRRYLFRYHVRMHNRSAMTVKLLSRSWTIRDVDGRVTYVNGPGVVGAFPTLPPETSYEYSSAAPLLAPVGTQSGHYVFVVVPNTIDFDNDSNEDLDNNEEDVVNENKYSDNDTSQSNIYKWSKDISSVESPPATNGGMLHVPVAPFGLRAPTVRPHSSDSRGSSAKAVTSSSQSGKSSRRTKRNDDGRRR